MLKFMFALLAAFFAGAAQAQVQVRVEDPWVRGMVDVQKATGAFMRLTSKTPAKLIGASTPAAGVTEIHQSTMEGGVMRMRPVDAIELPAGQAVERKPGGYHVMMMQVSPALKEGQTVPLTLVIETGGKRESFTVQVPVKALAGPAHPHGHKH
jgi:copper(I)-binding protein